MLGALVLVAAAVFVAVSLAPFTNSPIWWVRCWDFPRLQLAVTGTVLTGFALAVGSGPLWWALAAVLAGFTAIDWWRVLPYTPLWPVAVAQVGREAGGATVSVLISNVLMENRDTAKVADLIARRDPDIVFLTETDGFWAEELAETIARYPHKVVRPQENHYGLILLTRLPVVESELLSFADPDEPLVRIVLRLADGGPLTFWGLHPEPPIPGRTTVDRDADLVQVAERVRAEGGTAVVGGDLNDVAWSHTTRLFLRLSGLLDPRRGRGRFATFHADWPLLRWPLDHLFVSPDLVLREFSVEPHVGSDHFPVWAVLGRAPGARVENAEPETPEGDDFDEAQAFKARPEGDTA